ncbi:MAG: hypothetical protein R3F11_04450 [Verrucomicrobiales bacterium]
MLQWLFKKIVGSKNQRELKRLWPVVQEINQIEQGLQGESDDALRERTAKWKKLFATFHDPGFLGGGPLERAPREALEANLEAVAERFARIGEQFPEFDADVPSGAKLSGMGDDDLRVAIKSAHDRWLGIQPQFFEKEQALLNEILPEAFAVVKNAARRLCGQTVNVCDYDLKWEMVHFDVQLIGGMALHHGRIAEMATGEGKTLVATLPLYLNGLTGRGVHLITVNDYLARRDSEWMGALLKFLGLTVGCIQNDMGSDVRREMYQCDVTYGTNSEFGFDYLRDNGMARDKSQQVQRGHYFAIIDEVDSVLIDEARTPLIISGPVARDSHQYDQFKPLVAQLVRKQSAMCSEFIQEAKKAQDEDDMETAGHLLFKVKLAQPRNRGLLRAMEDPDVRRLIEKTELSYYQDTQKTALFALKEELFFTIEEKAARRRPLRKGREFLNPDDPEAFVLPDLAEQFSLIDGDDSLTTEEKDKRKQKLQGAARPRAERIHNITQLLKAFCLYERTSSMWLPTTR